MQEQQPYINLWDVHVYSGRKPSTLSRGGSVMQPPTVLHCIYNKGQKDHIHPFTVKHASTPYCFSGICLWRLWWTWKCPPAIKSNHTWLMILFNIFSAAHLKCQYFVRNPYMMPCTLPCVLGLICNLSVGPQLPKNKPTTRSNITSSHWIQPVF